MLCIHLIKTDSFENILISTSFLDFIYISNTDSVYTDVYLMIVLNKFNLINSTNFIHRKYVI